MPDNPVETHYTRHDLGEVILAALKAAGKDLYPLTPDDLAPVDEFHGGQRPATIRLAELVSFAEPSGCSMSARGSADPRDISLCITAAGSAASI